MAFTPTTFQIALLRAVKRFQSFPGVPVSEPRPSARDEWYIRFGDKPGSPFQFIQIDAGALDTSRDDRTRGLDQLIEREYLKSDMVGNAARDLAERINKNGGAIRFLTQDGRSVIVRVQNSSDPASPQVLGLAIDAQSFPPCPTSGHNLHVWLQPSGYDLLEAHENRAQIEGYATKQQPFHELKSKIWEPLPFDTPPPMPLAGPILRCIYELQFVGRLRLIRLAEQKQFEPTDDGRRVLFESVPTVALLAEFYKWRLNQILIGELRGALGYLLQNEYIKTHNLPRGLCEILRGRYVNAESGLPDFVGHDGRHIGKWSPFPPFEVSAIPKALFSAYTEESFRVTLWMASTDLAYLDAIIVDGNPIYWAFRRHERASVTTFSEPVIALCMGHPAHASGAPPGENFKIAERGIKLVEAASVSNKKSPEIIAFDDEDRAILRAIASDHQKLWTLVELEDESGVTRKTVGTRVTKLIDAGILHRPNGQRRGVTLTAKGHQVVKALPQ